ncbi:uncharacterized protein LOC121249259 [Juglans microcarpa x Juglans regia]|uniref:uncharacterized protein LOC121249259 n=1 Tax=Juglans microcarpa x Juglans regia TaxID=2249226 RepID=UPI001B7DB086|nr:uncharacterized protein LOC121249259 [Juglans microcarpa x Juglans regia]
MDREQHELQFLGFFGIFKESFKIIFSWRKIFSKITLALIVPLSFIFLAQIKISYLLFSDIVDEKYSLENNPKNSYEHDNLSRIISSDWTYFWLFRAACFIFLVILSLLSTAAIVYTIACIFTGKETTFKKVMRIVPKVWKRLLVTFIWSFLFVVVYHIVAAVLFILWAAFIGASTVGFVIVIVLLILYLIGFVYISIVWDLASVVSVLEDVYGLKAMIKSKALIKGKMGVAVAFFILISVCLVAIEMIFEYFVVLEMVPNIAISIMVGILSFLFLVMVSLFGFVVQTVVYLVCKSYHHEDIDKPSLADHLEGYLGEYVRLRAPKDNFQLGEVQV